MVARPFYWRKTMKKILLSTVAAFAVFALSLGAPAMADSFGHGGHNGGGYNPPPVVAPAVPDVQQSGINKGNVSNNGNNASGTLSGNFTAEANSATGVSNSISKTTNNASSSSSSTCACASIDTVSKQTGYNSGAISNTGVNNASGGAIAGVGAAQVNAATGVGNSTSSFVNIATSTGGGSYGGH
jgi:hypothetical protein